MSFLKNLNNEELAQLINIIVPHNDKSTTGVMFKRFKQALLGKIQLDTDPYALFIANNIYLKKYDEYNILDSIYKEVHSRLNPNTELNITDNHYTALYILNKYADNLKEGYRLIQFNLGETLANRINRDLFEYNIIEPANGNFSGNMIFKLTSNGVDIYNAEKQKRDDQIKNTMNSLKM